MGIVVAIWILIQLLIGYNLILPFLLFLWWKLSRHHHVSKIIAVEEVDYAIIVTAYEQTQLLNLVVSSLLKLSYNNFLIYIVADKCDVSTLIFDNDKVILLRPPITLASNTKSHRYAINNFKRDHERLTIIDSDNLVDPAYLNQLNLTFDQGFQAVQGLRAPKNLDTTIACLDAARDIYYHFYDGKLLFEIGSSATLSGSGMAFNVAIYKNFLDNNQVEGAGFDKVLQSWLVNNNHRIAFNDLAILYDEKTSKTEQLVHQRSRWINTWFKYFTLGLDILLSGIKTLSKDKVVFGIILLRPPLFIFLILSLLCLALNLILGYWAFATIWIFSMLIFVLSFWISLKRSTIDSRIYKSLINVPKFIFYQLISLLNARKANKISVATKHYDSDVDDINS